VKIKNKTSGPSTEKGYHVECDMMMKRRKKMNPKTRSV